MGLEFLDVHDELSDQIQPNNPSLLICVHLENSEIVISFPVRPDFSRERDFPWDSWEF